MRASKVPTGIRASDIVVTGGAAWTLKGGELGIKHRERSFATAA